MANEKSLGKISMDQCKMYFILKDDYFQIIEEIKTAGQNPGKKADSSTTLYPSK